MKPNIVKTLILCLQLAFAVAAYASSPGNGITSKLNSYKCENGKGVTSYTVYSDEPKVCDISFLAMPAEYKDGNPVSYTIKVNGVELAEKISFSESGWQEANTVDKAVTLNKGDNTIIFISNRRDIPLIKGIEFFKNQRRIAAVAALNKIGIIPHGYDWESKCGGAGIRIFHPRYALRGGYGQVVAHYRVADNQVANNRSPRSTMAEAIADGNLVMENIALTPEEEELLTEGVNNIPTKKRDGFEMLYGKWKTYTDAHRYESDMFKFRNCPEYTELLAYTSSIPDGELLAYDKFIKGNLFAAVLIKDLSTKPDSKTEQVWNSIMNAPSKSNTIRTPQTNITLFIKSVLKKTEANNITEGISHSNDDNFNVTISSSQLTVDIDLQKASKYSIQVMNLQGDYTYQLSPEKTAEKGKYTYRCDVGPGLYIVTYTLNGNINSKKIIVK